jgi:hypothetical protein
MEEALLNRDEIRRRLNEARGRGLSLSTRRRYEPRKDGLAADARAIASDWQEAGRGLWAAFRVKKRELKEED